MDPMNKMAWLCSWMDPSRLESPMALETEDVNLPEVARTVRALIGVSWAPQIKILSVGVAGADDVHDEGTPYVDLGATSDVACYQAMISIADHCLNPIEDWEENWIECEDGPRYRLRAWHPSARVREHA